jgi:hypothetical protein
MSGDSGGGGTSTTQTIQNNDPWSGQQDFLKSGFEQAKTDVLNRPLEYYSGQTVVDPSSQTNAALTSMENRATTGSPLQGSANTNLNKTLSGDFLDAGNPYFKGMVERSIDPMRQEFQNVVNPGIDSSFAGAGRYGSGAHAATRGSAADAYMRNVANTSASLGFQNYAQERGNQMQGVQMAPGLAAADYADAGMLAQVGAQREGYTQAQIQDQLNRFNFAQMEPQNRLGQYMGLIGGGYGGTSTQSQVTPTNSNPLLTGLGAASQGVGVAAGLKSLFGSSA